MKHLINYDFIQIGLNPMKFQNNEITSIPPIHWGNDIDILFKDFFFHNLILNTDFPMSKYFPKWKIQK